MLFLGTVLLGLCIYSYQAGPKHLQDAMAIPDSTLSAQGQHIRIGFAEVTEAHEDGTILLVSWGRTFQTKADIGKVRSGDRITLTGRVLEHDVIALESLTVHRFRGLKILASAIAAVLMLSLVISQYRFSLDTRCIVRKKACRT
jgi:hypothetical protein